MKRTLSGRDILAIADLSSEDLWEILNTALRQKKNGVKPVLKGETLALVFEKPSLRTRVSFDVAMQELGGHTIYLTPQEIGLGVREPISDVANVLSRYVSIIAARTFAHKTAVELAK